MKKPTQYESILCICRDVLLSNLIGVFLKDCGFSVYQSNAWQDTEKLMHIISFDLVIIDMQSSEGLKLIEKAKTELPGVAIVIIADAKDAPTITKAFKMGAWDCVYKPLINVTLLEHMICRALEYQRLLSSTVGSEAWNSRDLKSRPH